MNEIPDEAAFAPDEEIVDAHLDAQFDPVPPDFTSHRVTAAIVEIAASRMPSPCWSASLESIRRPGHKVALRLAPASLDHRTCERAMAEARDYAIPVLLPLSQEQLAGALPLVANQQAIAFVIERLGGPRFQYEATPQSDALERQWLDDLAKLAAHPNVVVELGGLSRPAGATSDALFSSWAHPVREAIEIFGPERAMFASRWQGTDAAGYAATWNAYQKIALGVGPSERNSLFAETARRIYRLDARESTHGR